MIDVFNIQSTGGDANANEIQPIDQILWNGDPEKLATLDDFGNGINSFLSLPENPNGIMSERILEIETFMTFLFSKGIVSKEEYEKFKEEIRIIEEID
jgi:hypothetical protein